MKNLTNDQIRAFHLTGRRGLDGFAPAAPLRPAVLGEGAGVPAAASPDLTELYARALREQRGKTRSRFLEKVRYCRDRMQELISLDDSRDPNISNSPAAVAASLGRGISFFNSGALAVALQGGLAANPVPRMSPARRKRCESTLDTLRDYLLESAGQASYWEFPAADVGAIAFCERQLDILTETLKAIRIALLEMECAYDPQIHDDAIARFTWESADTEEIAAMPAVLVVDSADRVAENSLSLFGKLLRSGLPMQILITCPAFYTGDLALLAVAHREAFVMQSALSSPVHLTEGLLDMTHTLRPAVAVISTSDPALFHESRAFPLFVYDPEAGEDWVQRFRLHAVQETELNAVHVAALSPVLCKHFLVLPKECWTEEQLELSVYMKAFQKQAPLSEPYLWVLDSEGVRQRAIVTRELIHISRDRQKAWRLLEELAEAGKPPAPVVDAAKVKEEAEKEGAKAAIYRMVSLLTGGSEVRPAAVASATTSTPASTSAVTSDPAPAAAPQEAVTDPYIDSALCTSCNDCTKINSRMFLYNAERQAYLGDTSGGTFAELVKAAEGCPARCIHPGSPRPGDRTATPKLIARAAKFNA